MKDELKPCPFCGGEAFLEKISVPTEELFDYLRKFTDGFLYEVWCKTDDCRCSKPLIRKEGSFSERGAIEAWNRRSQ